MRIVECDTFASSRTAAVAQARDAVAALDSRVTEIMSVTRRSGGRYHVTVRIAALTDREPTRAPFASDR